MHEGDLLFAEDIQEQRLIFNPESLREVDLIMEYVENGSPEQVSQSIREAFSQLLKNKTAPELVHIFITQILFRGSPVQGAGRRTKRAAEEHSYLSWASGLPEY